MYTRFAASDFKTYICSETMVPVKKNKQTKKLISIDFSHKHYSNVYNNICLFISATELSTPELVQVEIIFRPTCFSIHLIHATVKSQNPQSPTHPPIPRTPPLRHLDNHQPMIFHCSYVFPITLPPPYLFFRPISGSRMRHLTSY